MCVFVHFAWKGHPQYDLYCVVSDFKPYTLTHFETCATLILYCTEKARDVHQKIVIW